MLILGISSPVFPAVAGTLPLNSNETTVRYRASRHRYRYDLFLFYHGGLVANVDVVPSIISILPCVGCSVKRLTAFVVLAD